MLISTAQAQPFGGATAEGAGKSHLVDGAAWVLSIALLAIVLWMLVGGDRR